MAIDYQLQITRLYDKLAVLNTTFSRLATNARTNEFQNSIQTRVSAIESRLNEAETTIRDMQLDMTQLTSDIISLS